jgi:hypothetical protein
MAYKSSFNNSGAGSTIAVAVSGILEGDFVLIAVPVDSGSGVSVTWPSGFTNETKDFIGTPDGQSFAINWKYEGASPPSSYSVTIDNAPVLAFVTVLSGRSGSPTIGTVTKNTSSNASPISATWNGVTAADGDDIILVGGADETVGTDTWSFNAPASYTLAQNESPQNFINGFVAYRENVSAGATGSLSNTITRLTGSGNAGYIGYAIAVPAGVVATAAGSGTATGGITEAALAASDKYVDVTLTDTTYVPASQAGATPVIEAGDITASGNNTATSSWAVSTPALATGDLITIIIGWDDSTTATGSTPANGPNGETWSQIDSVVASASTEVRMTAYSTIATGSWSAGTITFTPSAAESWTAAVIKTPAGEFDASTPIGAVATRSSTTTAETSVLMPAFSAGASDGGGKLVWAAVVDSDPQTTLSAGYTSLSSVDTGSQSLSVQVRDAAVTDSESLSGGTRAIAGDSWASLAFIIRKPADTTPFNDARAAVIAGIDFSGSDTHGGDAELANVPVTSITRLGDGVMRILFDDFSAYDITADEDYTITLPASVTVAGTPIEVTGTFSITATVTPPSGVLAGTAIPSILESDVKTAGTYTVQWVVSDVEFIGNS